MQSFTVVTAILLSVCVLGCMAQYGGYAPHPKPAAKHAPVYHHAPAPMHHGGYHGGKGGHVPCGANLLVSCSPHVAHVPCVPAHGGGHHQYHHGGHHGGYRAFEQSETEADE
ncbi:vitelline membrane protein 15a-2-like [Anopheles funestus]|uniref:VM domain-containing protein n=1 Tax=Anopheles funestus TaxID=62324 RepID=A0A182R3X8_ANOFN|nr:vitelline membrane protein 15a-2-like [Anopheles funestus]